jgi:hypothetical protein
VRNVVHAHYVGPPDRIDSESHFRDLMYFTRGQQAGELLEAGVKWVREVGWVFPDGHVCTQGTTEAHSRLKNLEDPS